MDENFKSTMLDLITHDEEDYTEETFSKFLTLTKDSLSKLTLEQKTVQADDIESPKDESDREFRNFLGQLKKISASCEKSKKSPLKPTNAVIDKYSENSLHDSVIIQDQKKSKNSPSLESNLPDVEAEYQKLFDTSRKDCSRKLYEYFNENIFDNKLPHDLVLEWSDDLRSTAGTTRGERKGGVYVNCSIQLAKKVLTSYERLRDTLIHEMCHAAVMMISQISGDTHGPLWKTWAARCNLILPHITIPKRCHNYKIAFPFYYQCKECPWRCGRHKRTIQLATARCPKCCSSLSLIKA